MATRKKKTTKKAATRKRKATKKRGVGRPRDLKITDELRDRVKTLAGYGLTHREIAAVVINPRTGKPIAKDTLQRNFKQELEVGPTHANASVVQSLYRAATSGNVTAQIWWTKCRAGWRERSVVEVESKTGVLVTPAQTTPEEWVAAAKKADEAKG